LVKAEALTEEERLLLLETTTGTVGRGIMGHTAVLGWIALLLDNGVRNGVLGGGTAGVEGATLAANSVPFPPPIALQQSLQQKVMDLRAVRHRP